MTTRNKWRRSAARFLTASCAAGVWVVAEEAYLPRLGPSPLRFGDAYPFLTPPHIEEGYDPRKDPSPPILPTVPSPVVVTNSPAPEPQVVIRASPPSRPEPVALSNAPPALPQDALDTGSNRSASSLKDLVLLFRQAVKTTNGVQEIIVPMPFVPGTPGESKSSQAKFDKP